MLILPLAKVSFIMSVLGLIWVVSAVSLILLVLIQKGRGGGLSAAFGGAGGSSLLGTKTGDFLTWVTIGLVAVFLLLGVVLAKYYRPVSGTGLEAPVAPVSAPAGIPEQPPLPEAPEAE